MSNEFYKPSDASPGVQASSDEATFRLVEKYNKKQGFLDTVFNFGGVPNKELVFFTREFSILLNANVPIVETLNILNKQTKHKRLQNVIRTIADTVESGSTLSAALANYPDIFNNLFISLVKTGEISGTLDQSLTYIADQQEKDYNLRKKVKGAMTYPLFVITAMVGVLGLLFTFVMPKMLEMLSETGAELPFTTKILIFVTDIFSNFWWVFLIIILGAVIGFRYALTTPDGKMLWDRTKLRLPVVGGIIQKVYIERFARNFAILVKGGVPVVTGLRVTADAIGSLLYKKILMDIADQVENGRPLAQAMGDYPDELPGLVTQMVQVGEQTSKTDEILVKIAGFYERETEQSLATLTQLLEPIVMIMLGGVVAIIVSGILLPIYNLVTAQ